MPMESAFYRVLETTDTLEDLERLCATALAEVHRDERLQRVYTVLLLKCEYTEDMGSLIERERAAKEDVTRSEEHTSELQSLMRNSYAVFCLKKKTKTCLKLLTVRA